jgi:hypothetical protein
MQAHPVKAWAELTNHSVLSLSMLDLDVRPGFVVKPTLKSVY